ncbi:tetratricopeptide repeat protein [Pelagicoccus sp. SDUM812002]|uniref:tetratricopeptide repeat protein n=1 Tax=Pelagicoccus sp. SDUM812002 TaxID=3041266 RepID=UPI00280DF897|nr:tetratricopeptide repeat protein [Pelagicoccus sp. SDUM812002]MDQ8188042.1 tetratricopeptide repeat protein [Pelagicoccus sp. SDUM812002]
MTDSPQPESNKPETKPSFFAELKRRKVFRVAATYIVVAWIIIQVAAATFPGFEIPMWAFRFVVLMLLLGFPVAVILAWAFELTPDGVKLTKNVSEEAKAETSQSKRNWLSLGFAAALPAVIFGSLALYFYITREASTAVDPASEALDKSIAVLPFDNRSNLDEDQFFTDGIHDDLLTQISRIHDIKTISRTSVMTYKDTTKNMKQIGEELGVATLLEGGVQRAGDRVRINMQLIDAQTDAHLWAETYTRELTAENIFEIQSEIAAAIADELKAILSDEEQQRLKDLPTDNLEALESYFKGLASDYSADGLRESIAHFKKATELDPDFALAHARLAHVYQSQIWYSGLAASEQIAKSMPHLDRALELDPGLSDAWVVKGLIYRELGEYEEAETAYQKAIELNPNSDGAYTNYSLYLFYNKDEVELALEMVDRAIVLNPEDPNLFIHKAEILEQMGRDGEALKIWDSLNRRYPNDSNVQMQVAGNLAASEADFDLVIKSLRRAHFLDPENLNAVNFIMSSYNILGSEAKVRFWLERGIALYPNSDYRYLYEIFLLIRDGDLEKAHQRWLTEFAKGYVGGGSWRVYLMSYQASADFSAGHPERVLQRYRLVTPRYFERDFEFPLIAYSDSFENLESIVFIAKALELSGETERGRALLDRAVRYAETHFADENVTPLAKAFQGRYDEVVTWLTPRYKDKVGGERKFEGMPWEPILDKEPLAGYNARHAAWSKEILERIATMEANGELAPLPER